MVLLAGSKACGIEAVDGAVPLQHPIEDFVLQVFTLLDHCALPLQHLLEVCGLFLLLYTTGPLRICLVTAIC